MGFKLTAVAVVGAALLGMVIKVPERWFYTEFQLTPQPQGAADSPKIPDHEKDGVQFEDVRFPSSDPLLKLHGWSFTPTKELSQQNENHQFPVVIMGHGIGATKDMGLFPFAMEFAQSGFMVLVFDYLHFGQSGIFCVYISNRILKCASFSIHTDGTPRRMFCLSLNGRQ